MSSPQGQLGGLALVGSSAKAPQSKTVVRRRRPVRTVSMPRVVAFGLAFTVMVLLFGVMALFGAYRIQRNIIGNLDRKLSVTETKRKEAEKENQAWKTNFHTWVDYRVEEKLAAMQKASRKGPPPISSPEEEGFVPDQTDEEVLAEVQRIFGSSEESGPGR